MSKSRVAVVQVGWLLIALCASAAVKNNNIRIKVLDSETRSVIIDDSGVPKNCDAVNFDAYCHNSKTSVVTNTLLVQEGDQPPFRITCTADTKWSRCVPLTQGLSFDARRDKRGLVVYYSDDYGKLRKQLYVLVDPGAAEREPTSTATSVSRAPNPGPDGNRAQTGTASAGKPGESVKCSFISTPAGAEVAVDGHYVGSTPSVLSLSVGDHAVEVSLRGFVLWKRDLTVSTGSELTVNAVLEKAQ